MLNQEQLSINQFKAEALSISEIRYRRLFESAKEGILILDAVTGKILDVNPFLIELLGYSTEEFLDRAIWDIGLLKDIVANKDKFAELQQKEYVRYENLPLETANGRKIYVEFISNLYLENDFKVIQCNIVDITKRKQAEEQLEQYSEKLTKLNAEKDKFFSIIAHDLRSPFNVFLGYTRMMVEDLNTFSTSEILEISIRMQNSATNLFNLLENLLEWSRLQQGLIAIDRTNIQLCQIVDNSLATILDLAKNKSIEIAVDIPDDIMIFADRNIIQTIIRNIVSNAVKFTPKSGKITISGRSMPDKSIKVTIVDTGIGMSAGLVKDLFRLDVQSNRKGTEGEPSTGLGLIICKDFIELHGGQLWVASAVGKGSTFKFSLPSKINSDI